MPGFMTAPQARALYDRAQRPRPSHVTPERNAALAAILADEIRVARASGAVMAAQGHNGCAAGVFAEAARMTGLREFYRGGSEEGDDASPT